MQKKPVENAAGQKGTVPVYTPRVKSLVLEAIQGITKTPEQKAEAVLLVLKDLTIAEWKVLRVYMGGVQEKQYGLRAVYLLEVFAQIWRTRKNIGILADEYFAKEKDIMVRDAICEELRKESKKGSSIERSRDLFYALASDQNDWVNYIFEHWDTYSYQAYQLAN